MKVGSAKQYDRYLSPVDVWALSIGCVIGWGAFVMPGSTFLPVAGPGGTLIAMIISVLVTLVIGYNYVFLMNRYPGTGGVYSYSKEIFGRDHAFLSAWFICLSYVALIPQNVAIFALIIRILTGDLLLHSFHYSAPGTEVYLSEIVIEVLVLAAIGFFAILMKPFLQKVQTVLGIILVAGIVLTAVMVTPHVDISELFQTAGTLQEDAVKGIMSIIILAPWAFVGFEVISFETAHFSFPVKRSGRLVAGVIVIGGAVYSIMAITAITRQPEMYADWQSYISSISDSNSIESIPTFYAMNSLFGKPGIWLISITAFSAVTSSMIGFYRASARILMNMAEDHILTDTFNKPASCFLFLLGLSSFISLVGRTAISWIVDLSSLGAIVGFGYVSAAVFSVARKSGQRKDMIMGSLGMLFTICFAAAQLLPGISAIETMKAESYFLLAFWCMIGFAFYWRTMRKDPDEGGRYEGITTAALFFLMIFSTVIWYAKKMAALSPAELGGRASIAYSVVLLLFVAFGMIVMLLIYSQLKKKQLLLEADKIRAIETSQAKTRFLFNMSHDIRTPMNAVLGYADLALKEPLPDKARSHIEKIQLSGKHLLSLINDILEMSRIENGKLDLDERPDDLIELFDEMRTMFSEQMKEKNIDFVVDTDKVRHRYVSYDKDNLAKILFNLIGNAYKFTDEGGKITVTLIENESDEASAAYEIHVKDNGRGMSQEFMEKLFTAFERERTSTDSGIQGTGLGLAITKSIVDLMSGEIKVESVQGSGTEMTVDLTFSLSEEIEKDEDERKAEPEEKKVDFTGKRVLLVDDNAVNREIANMILDQAGFRVDTAENGKIAVEKVESNEPGTYDAILMDIQMPIMDGYTATREIRKLDDPEKQSVPIIAITANAFKEDAEEALAAGMQAHVAKPIDINVLLDTLSRFVK